MTISAGESINIKNLVKKAWQINRSANRVLIIIAITNLDGFSLVNFPLQNIPATQYNNCVIVESVLNHTIIIYLVKHCGYY